MKKVEKAMELFSKGYNCSQAVFTAFSENMGIEKEAALKIASAFGGGMGCTGGTCGAVTGALMVIGLRHGSTGTGQKDSYERAKRLLERFAERNGTSLCKELLKCDIGTEEGMKKARKEDLFTTICPRLVRDAAEIIEGME